MNGINTANSPVVRYYSEDEYYYPPSRQVAYVIPANCELSVDRGRGFERAYFRGRLAHAGFANLPNRCDFTVYTERGPRDAIPRWCMMNAGYRFRN